MRKYSSEIEPRHKSASTDKPRILGKVLKMPYCMCVFLLIREQKTKKLLKKSVYRHLKREINHPKSLFSQNLHFTCSKIKKSALLWIVVHLRNMKATSTTWPIKRSLLRSLGGCSPSWQRALLPGSSLLLILS